MGELQPGESLLWTGRPRLIPAVLRTLPRAAIGLFLVAIGVGGVASLLTFGAGRNLGTGVFLLALIGFGGMGVAFFGTPFWTYHRARHTAYALTDRRAIVREPSFPAGSRVRTFPPAQVRQAERREGHCGRGDLIFEDRSVLTQSGLIWSDCRGFLDLDDIRRVEHLIRSTLWADRPSN